jgi:hypothetical protein
VSAFDLKSEEELPNQETPPLPEQLEKFYDPRQAMMSTVDWRLSESLKQNINSFQQEGRNIKVEDLISRVKLENGGVSQWPNNPRRRLVLNDGRPHNTLERAFEEFQIQQSINL